MKTEQEIIAEQQSLSKQRDLNNDGFVSKEEDRQYLLLLASQLLQFLRNETLSVEESNPKDYDKALKAIEKAIIAKPITTEVSVKNQKDYNSKLDAVLLAIKQIKIPEVKIPAPLKPVDPTKELKNIESAVKSIKIPEVKIPEQKEVDFSPLIKEIKTLGKSLDVKGSADDIKTQNILSAVLTQLEKGLSNIEVGIARLDKEPEVQKDRTNEVLKGLKDVSETIQNIQFPVATFKTDGIISAIENISVTIPPVTVGVDKIMAGPIEDGAYMYIGYMEPDETFYIKRQNTSTALWGYCYFSTDFPTNWAGKASLTYGDPE